MAPMEPSSRATQPHRPLVASNRTNDGHIGPLSMVPRAAGVAGAHTYVSALFCGSKPATAKDLLDPLYFSWRRITGTQLDLTYYYFSCAAPAPSYVLAACMYSATHLK